MYTIVIIALIFVIVLLCILLMSKSPTASSSKQECPPCKIQSHTPSQTQTILYTPLDPVVNRDVRVIKDELYPPYNRPSYDVTRRYMNEPILNPVPTRDGSNDTYRIVGYLVSEEDKNDVWKLFAREKHRGSSADFYASPANRNYDMKIHLNQENMIGPNKFKDLYDMPDQLMFNHPMFSRSTYRVVSLSNSDYSSTYF